MMIEEISATTLKAKFDAGENFQLIDVRQPNENSFASIEGGKLIPLGEIVSRMDELDPNVEAVVYCKWAAGAHRLSRFSNNPATPENS